MTSPPPSPNAPGDLLLLDLPGGSQHEFTLGKASVTIGRGARNDIALADASVARRHARVERGAHGCEIHSLAGASALRVNGVGISRAILEPGDVIALGDKTLRFERRTAEGHAPHDHVLALHLGETVHPRLAVLASGMTREMPIKGDAMTIGRARDNDLVIDCEGIAPYHAVLERVAGGFRMRDLGSHVTRSQRAGRGELLDGDSVGIGSARLVFKGGYTHEHFDAAATGAHTARPPVVVLPGFAGSNLWCGSQQVWPTREAFLHMDLLRIDSPLEARGLVDEVVIVPHLIKHHEYGALTNFLKEDLGYESGRDLLEFGYDFRQDNRESARRLAAAIDGWGVKRPITLIAHSMGCLVARYYLDRLGGSRFVERAIFLGGPHHGTPYAFASLMTGPNLLPMGLMNARLRELLAGYPSWYQILPTYPFASHQGAALNVLEDDSWLAGGQRALLRNAREFRAELGESIGVPALSVFGYGMKTTTAAIVERETLGICHKADFTHSPHGDGMIPESSAVMPRSDPYPVHQHHGSLYSDGEVKMRLARELIGGAG